MRTYSRRRPPPQPIQDVQELCRLCLARTPEMTPIFPPDHNDNVFAALPMRIMMCVGLEVSKDDKLPQLICHHCNQELNRFYVFKKNCNITYRKLKANMLTVKQMIKTETGAGCAQPLIINSLLGSESNHDTDKTQKNVEVCKQETDRSQIGLENGMNPIKNERNLSELGSEYNRLENKNTIVKGIINKHESSTGLIDQNMQEHPTSTDHTAQLVQEQPKPTDFTNQNLEADGEVHHIVEVVQEQQDQIMESQENTNIAEHLSAYIVTALVENGVLAARGDRLEVLDQSFKTFQLETVDGSHIVMELVEEEPTDMLTSGAGEPGCGDDLRRCGECGARLSSRAALARHARVHSGERPFECHACGRRFAQREVLRRHELLHADQRPYQCALCPKSYTQRSALAAHTRAHAPPGARPAPLHRCARCPKAFLYSSGLSRHMSAHAGRQHACEVCARAFTDRSSLLRHARLHQRAA